VLSLAAFVLSVQPTIVPPPPVEPMADPLELELVWRAPPSCPDAEAIEARIRALLPGDPGGEGVLVVEGDVAITDEGAHLVLVSTFRGESERRELRAPDCAELGEATAVLLAVALEPARQEEIEHAAAPNVPAPSLAADPISAEQQPVDAPTSSTRSRSRASASRPVGWALRLAAGIDAGGVPPPTGAVQGAAILEWSRARLELHGVWLVPRTERDATTGRGGTYQIGAAGLHGCGRLFAGPVEFPLCLGAEAGTVRGRSATGTQRVAFGPWVGALASVGVARAWRRVGIWSAAEALGRVVGSKFLVGQDVVERQWPVSLRVLVGIEIRGSWIRRGGGQ
jgi:hypothetical protein